MFWFNKNTSPSFNPTKQRQKAARTYPLPNDDTATTPLSSINGPLTHLFLYQGGKLERLIILADVSAMCLTCVPSHPRQSHQSESHIKRMCVHTVTYLG